MFKIHPYNHSPLWLQPTPMTPSTSGVSSHLTTVTQSPNELGNNSLGSRNSFSIASLLGLPASDHSPGGPGPSRAVASTQSTTTLRISSLGNPGSFSIANLLGLHGSGDESRKPTPVRTTPSPASTVIHPYFPRHTPLFGGTYSRSAPAKLTKSEEATTRFITAEDLRELRDLGPKGIAAKGGLKRIARRLKVSYGTLKSLINERCHVKRPGLRKLGEASDRPITAQDLLYLESLGKGGIDDRGGLRAICDGLEVNYNSMTRLIQPDGELTPGGQRRLGRKKAKPVTADHLRDLRDWGEKGVAERGGIAAIANTFEVNYSSLTPFVHPGGELTRTGLRKLHGIQPRRITVSDLQYIRDLKNKGGIGAYGGRRGISEDLEVSYSTLIQLIDEHGVPTPRGARKLGETRAKPVTANHLRQIQKWGEDGIARRGGLPAIAIRLEVSYSTLIAFIDMRGQLTRQGKVKVGEARNRRITLEDIQKIQAWGQQGIIQQGGLTAIADALEVSGNTLRTLINACGVPSDTALRKWPSLSCNSATSQ